jgi:hypothetical protein
MLAEGFNHHVSVRQKRPGIMKLIAPLFHEDGDMVDIFLEELGQGQVRVSDKGLSLMRLSYSFEIDTDNKERIFQRILNENRIEELGGNLYLDVALTDLYPAVLHFGQTVAKITNMSLYRREVIANLFYEQLQQDVMEQLAGYGPREDVLPIESREELVVDFALTTPKTPIYLFGVKQGDSAKARFAALSCLEFERQAVPFRSVVIHQDFAQLTKRDQAIITNAVDKQFTSIDEFRSLGPKAIERLAA